MKIYAKIGYADQQFGGNCPDSFIEIHTERPNGDWYASVNGKWLLGRPYSENSFINEELIIIKLEIDKHADSDPHAIATEQN